jgi:hypothetical protein
MLSMWEVRVAGTVALQTLTLSDLMQCDIPVHWGEQRRAFGFS